jgi:hypothetical protein
MLQRKLAGNRLRRIVMSQKRLQLRVLSSILNRQSV